MTTAEQHIGVQVNNENYAIPILDVHEIIRMLDITYVPDTRTSVLGVINLRGKTIPVMSLSERLGFSAEEYTPHTRIVVVACDEGEIGVIVDSVNEVLSFNDIQPSPENGKVAYLLGIGVKGNVLMSILDLKQLVSC